VIGRCVYGVEDKGKEPFLLEYYARTAIGCRGLDKKLPDEAKHPLQLFLAPARDERVKPEGKSERPFPGADDPWAGVRIDRSLPTEQGRVRVLWQGKPLIEAEVTIIGKKPITTKTDKEGEAVIPFIGPDGPELARVFLVRHIEEKKGTFEGKKYSSVRHYATLVFDSPLFWSGKQLSDHRAITNLSPMSPETIALLQRIILPKPAKNPEATKLLADARAARANWDHFPGFAADVEVNVDGTRTTGKMEVSNKGKVTLDMKGDAKGWARRMISSIVGHRMDDSTTLTTPCAFADDVAHHPMGRAIRVLNDEYHSSYRIRDHQVIEVNRTMGESRFTISVLENRTNAEKKFLPASYVVNTWNVKTAALQNSVAHYNTWKRIGKYDLPHKCLIVTAQQGKLVNRSIHFSNLKLLTK
jgi:hypothetical protein